MKKIIGMVLLVAVIAGIGLAQTNTTKTAVDVDPGIKSIRTTL